TVEGDAGEEPVRAAEVAPRLRGGARAPQDAPERHRAGHAGRARDDQPGLLPPSRGGSLMRLNTLKPAKGSKPQGKRPGRGHSAGQGKTAGRGTKGQHARAGGYHKIGFEGGQMPLQRRLPKVGFRSFAAGETAELRLHELA